MTYTNSTQTFYNVKLYSIRGKIRYCRISKAAVAEGTTFMAWSRYDINKDTRSYFITQDVYYIEAPVAAITAICTVLKRLQQCTSVDYLLFLRLPAPIKAVFLSCFMLFARGKTNVSEHLFIFIPAAMLQKNSNVNYYVHVLFQHCCDAVRRMLGAR